MNLLITGASGFLGRRVERKLCQKHKTTIIVRKGEMVPKACSEIIIAELGVKNDLASKVVGLKMDMIIHIAGATDSNRLSLRLNEEMAKNVVEAAKRMGVKKILFVSSNSVNYSNREYALSKKNAETIIMESGVDYAIVRPAMLIGKESSDIRSTLNAVRMLPVVIVPGGNEGKSTPLYVEDAADFIVQCAEKFDKCRNKIISIGGLNTLTLLELTETILRAYGINKKIMDVPSWTISWINPEYYKGLHTDISVNNTEAQKVFNWKPKKITYKEILG